MRNARARAFRKTRAETVRRIAFTGAPRALS